MIKKCSVCDGTGYVKSDEDKTDVDNVQDVQNVEDNPKVVKKKSHWSKKA